MAQLPPKIPNMSPSWPDFSSHQNLPSLAYVGTNNTNHYHHHHNQNPSWVDEFLDFSSARRGAHRRSVSDSITFLEAPMLEDSRGNPAMPHSSANDNEFDKFDDEQFMSMFTDEISGVPMPPTLSSSNNSSPSDQNFINDEKETNQPVKLEEEVEKQEHEEEEKQQHQLKNEPDEVESQCKQEITEVPNNMNATSSNDRITDPKRVKR